VIEPTTVGTAAATSAFRFVIEKIARSMVGDAYINGFRTACINALGTAVTELLPSVIEAKALMEVLERHLHDDRKVRDLLSPFDTLGTYFDVNDNLQTALREFLRRSDADLDSLAIDPSALAVAFSERLQHELHRQASQGAPTGLLAVLLGIARLQADTSALADPRRTLAELYVDPSAMFQELGVSRLAGRQWLFDQLESFVSRHDRGYAVITANAGLGKSTVLGYLAQRYGFPAHFTRLVDKPSDAGIACGNLAAQLSTRYDIPPVEAAELSRRANREVDSLARLMRLTAAAREKSGSSEPIIILFDGLDEVDPPPPGRNPLNLPKELPAGCFIVVAQRPQAPRIRADAPLEYFTIDPSGADNRDDMRIHLEGCAQQAELATLLAESSISAEAFTDTLLEKSDGVWIYLHYVLTEIRSGLRTPLSLDALPNGLRGYYAQYWESWRAQDENEWLSWHRDLITTLALAREPLTPAMLAKLAGGHAEPARVRALVAGPWRPFITHLSATDRFELYHLSLREYILWTDQRAPGDVLNHELDEAVRESQRRVAAVLMASVEPIIEATGPIDSAALTATQLYALDHLVPSLIETGALEAACEVMLRAELSVPPRLRWLTLKKSRNGVPGFLNDIDFLFAATADGGEAFGEYWQSAGPLWLSKLALVAGSVQTMAAHRPVEFIIAATKCGNWTPRRALCEVVWSEDRMGLEALCALAPFLPEPDRTLALDRALAMSERRAEPSRHWQYPVDPLSEPSPAYEELRALSLCAATVTSANVVRPTLSARLLATLRAQGLTIHGLLQGIRAVGEREEIWSRFSFLLACAVAFRAAPARDVSTVLESIDSTGRWLNLRRALEGNRSTVMSTVQESFGDLLALPSDAVALLLMIAADASDGPGTEACIAELERRSVLWEAYPLEVAALVRQDPSRTHSLLEALSREHSTDGLLDLVELLPPDLATKLMDRYERALSANDAGLTSLIEMDALELCIALAYLASASSAVPREATLHICPDWSSLSDLREEILVPLARLVPQEELIELMSQAPSYSLGELIEHCADRLRQDQVGVALQRCLDRLPSQALLRCFVALAPRMSGWPVDDLLPLIDSFGLAGERAAACAAVALHHRSPLARSTLSVDAAELLADEAQEHLRLEVLPLLVAATPDADESGRYFDSWLAGAQRLITDERSDFRYVPWMVPRLEPSAQRVAYDILCLGSKSFELHEVICSLGQVLTFEECLRELQFHLAPERSGPNRECCVSAWLPASGLFEALVSLLPGVILTGHASVLGVLTALSPGIRQVLRSCDRDALVKAVSEYPTFTW
jgi:hypothetical protein